jgi:flagellar hook-basal body complex protein FliE
MADLKIQNPVGVPAGGGLKSPKAVHDPLTDFKKVMNGSLREVNNLLSQADQTTQEMVLGKQDIHQAMVSIEQANLSLRLMIQVRNKMISAYEEIMRMQI